MVNRDTLNNLIRELEREWEQSTQRISRQVEQEIARRGGIERIRPEALTEAAIEIEAEQRARAITNSVIQTLLQQIEELEGRIENLETRIRTLGSPGPTGTP